MKAWKESGILSLPLSDNDFLGGSLKNRRRTSERNAEQRKIIPSLLPALLLLMFDIHLLLSLGSP